MRGYLTPEMEIVSICQEMKWTYYEYISQPSWFLELLKLKFHLDSQRVKKQLMKSKK